MKNKLRSILQVLFITSITGICILLEGSVGNVDKLNIYEVGPGQAYTRIGDVLWSTLGPGATVRIHYRANPYKEKFVVSTSGTTDNPIHIIGIKGLPCKSIDTSTSCINGFSSRYGNNIR